MEELTRTELESAVMDKLRASPSWRSYDEDVFRQAISMKTTAQLREILEREESRQHNKETK